MKVHGHLCIGMKRLREPEASGVTTDDPPPSVSELAVMLTQAQDGMENATNLAALAPAPTGYFGTYFSPIATTNGVSVNAIPSGTAGQVLAVQSNGTWAFENSGKSASYTPGEVLKAKLNNPDQGSIESIAPPSNGANTQLVYRVAGGDCSYTNVTTAGVWMNATTSAAPSAGTVPIAMGGTGATSFTANQILQVNSGATAVQGIATIPVSAGGTNSSSFTADELVVANSGGTALVSVPAGADGNFLSLSGGVPTWVPSSPSSYVTTATYTLNATQITQIMSNATPSQYVFYLTPQPAANSATYLISLISVMVVEGTVWDTGLIAIGLGFCSSPGTVGTMSTLAVPNGDVAQYNVAEPVAVVPANVPLVANQATVNVIFPATQYSGVSDQVVIAAGNPGANWSNGSGYLQITVNYQTVSWS